MDPRIISYCLLTLSAIQQALACDPAAPPETEQVGHITYAKYSDYYSVYDYPDSASGPLSIPAQIDGIPVTSIRGVYNYSNGPVSSCGHRGKGAFDHCEGLTSVTIPSGITTIGAEAFLNCTALTRVEIPQTVSDIGDAVFAGCRRLETIDVDSANTSYVSIEGVLYTSDMTKLVQYPGAKSGDYTIPDGVTEIGIRAFKDCNHLTGITIPEGVETIQPHTFAGCQNLKSIAFPKSLTWIAISAFADCAMLKEIVIPENVTDIAAFAFSNCNELSKVSIPPGVQYMGLQWPGSWRGRFHNGVVGSPFAGCSSLTVIDVDPENHHFESIGGVLYNEEVTKLLNFPAGLDGEFQIPSGVIEIAPSAFAGSSGLSSIELPETLTTIGARAFDGCSKLVGMRIPASVESIQWGGWWDDGSSYGPPFVRCPSLIAIEVDSENPHYESVDGVLYNDQKSKLLQFPAGLEGKFEIPSGVIQIASLAFSECSRLSSIELPKTLTTISERAFEGCSELIGVSIPAGVETIGWRAFGDCSRLTNALFLGSSPGHFFPEVFPGAAPNFSIYYRPDKDGFSSPMWNGYPAKSAEAPEKLKPLSLQRTANGAEIRWASPEDITFEVFYSENMVDWIQLTDVAIAPVGGGLAVYVDADKTRMSIRSGFYMAKQ